MRADTLIAAQFMILNMVISAISAKNPYRNRAKELNFPVINDICANL